MPIKDTFVGLFVKRFVISGAQYFDKPGFVDFKISGKTEIYARQIFYSEDFFVKFEKDLIDQFGEDAKLALYSVGKKFGYRFAQSGKFENVSGHPGEKIKDWILVASKFVEGTYASSIENSTDVSLKKTDYKLKNFVILRKLGFEYLFSMGGTAGLMSWIFQDPNIEVVMHDVKKNGDFEAIVTSAPLEYLKNNYASSSIYQESNISDLSEDFASYKKFNTVSSISSQKSFQTYLNAKYFSYKQGLVMFKEYRFFLFEVSGTYLLEYELKKLNPKYLKVLFDSAYCVGEKILSQFATALPDVFDVLSAIGWGEVLLFSESKGKIKILINHFPWSRWYKDIDFIIMRGFLSGIVSSKKGTKIEFNKPTIDLTNGHLSLLFEANL